MSQVKHNAHDFFLSTRTGVKLDYAMDRAEERTGPEDVGEQALMRGLDTAFPFFRLGLSRSEVGRRSDDRPHSLSREFPCRGPVLTSTRLMSAAIALDAVGTEGLWVRSSALRLERSTAPDDITPFELPSPRD